MSWPECTRCGSGVDPSTRTCARCGVEITSEAIIGVASTIGNGAHEVAGREKSDETSLAGKQLGKYTIVDLVGRGGMGAVYRAKHEELGHFAAIKILDQRLVNTPDVISRLFREARAAAQIGHVNIVQVFDFGRDPDIGGYIVMELVQGLSLEDGLALEKRFEETRIKSVALEICAALGSAHEKGIVHRDLKPANVLLQKTASGELVKVMDFGIAKVTETLGENVTASATQPGAVLGTPRYMSPEQWSSEPVDARTDIYSLGVMLYRMATGSLPHPKALTIPQLARAVTQRVEPAPRTIRPELGEGLEALILKCCEPERKDRYASMAEVSAALRALESPNAITSRRVAAKRPKRLPFALAAGALLLAGGAYAALRPRGGHEAPPAAIAAATTSVVTSERTAEPAAASLPTATEIVDAAVPMPMPMPKASATVRRPTLSAPSPPPPKKDLLFGN